MKRCKCSVCGKLRNCFKNLINGRWVFTCWPCLDEDEDGYVIQL